MPQFGLPCAVRAISITNPLEIHDFPSLGAAKAKIKEWTNKSIHHSTVKRRAQNKSEEFGYRWEMINSIDVIQKADVKYDNQDTDSLNELSNILGDDFNKVRKVWIHDAWIVSALDVIKSISPNPNPGSTYDRICNKFSILKTLVLRHQFPGSCQRLTPAIKSKDVPEFIKILMTSVRLPTVVLAHGEKK